MGFAISPVAPRKRKPDSVDLIDRLRRHYEHARDWSVIAADLLASRHGRGMKQKRADEIARAIWERITATRSERDTTDEPQPDGPEVHGPSYRES